MGMDAKARIFYGYKEPIDRYDLLNEDYELSDDNADMIIARGPGYDRHYLAVANSYKSFDWDYGIQTLDPAQMAADTENNSYFFKVRNFLVSKEIDYKSENIGWFVICDFS